MRSALISLKPSHSCLKDTVACNNTPAMPVSVKTRNVHLSEGENRKLSLTTTRSALMRLKASCRSCKWTVECNNEPAMPVLVKNK